MGLFNRGRYEIDAPPRPKKGEPEPKKVWKLRDRGAGKATAFDSEEDAVAALNKTAETIEVSADWSELHLQGKQPVRDLWRQKTWTPPTARCRRRSRSTASCC